ncbi:hypothetical protein AXA91_27850 [Salmonella enterica]|nr:hypothetical protein [Salmonella enterica]
MVIIIVGIQNATIFVRIPDPNPSEKNPLPINRLSMIDKIQQEATNILSSFLAYIKKMIITTIRRWL